MLTPSDERVQDKRNFTPFEGKYALMKSTTAAHMAPAALQLAATNSPIQLVAFALSLLMPQSKWPAGTGLVLAFLLCVVCLIHELNTAHEHNIPD